MPYYTMKCLACKHVMDIKRSMSDTTPTICPKCHKAVMVTVFTAKALSKSRKTAGKPGGDAA